MATGRIPINGTAAIQETIVDAKGDLIVGTGADAVARLAVGTNGYTLVADSAETTGLKWAAAAAGGKVLQVVSGTTTTEAESSSSTYADTGLTATITPSATNSKILVLAFNNGAMKDVNNTSMGVRLMRGATEIALMHYRNLDTQNSNALGAAGSTIAWLDSPNTTSATTYKTQFRSDQNNSRVRIQWNSTASSIVLLEIGA
jgi:hypothetical protein